MCFLGICVCELWICRFRLGIFVVSVVCGLLLRVCVAWGWGCCGLGFGCEFGVDLGGWFRVWWVYCFLCISVLRVAM